uniref:30S ribosomal protein S14 n=1 Tax=Microbispora rosea TaxID=58117 RepID=UPI0004C410AE
WRTPPWPRHSHTNPQLADPTRSAASYTTQRDITAPGDASATRVRNRDAVDGRPRGYLGTFGLSRIRFRQMAHRGELPGVTKASW